MSLESFLVRTVTIQTAATTVDRYNNTVADWTTPASSPTKAWVTQTGTLEDQDHRDAAVTTATVTLPAHTAVTAQDRIVIDGAVFEVVGEPNRRWTPRGEHHVEVDVRECAG